MIIIVFSIEMEWQKLHAIAGSSNAVAMLKTDISQLEFDLETLDNRKLRPLITKETENIRSYLLFVYLNNIRHPYEHRSTLKL